MTGLFAVQRWPMWALPLQAILVVLAVDALGVAAVSTLMSGAGAVRVEQWSFAVVVFGALVLAYVVECREGTVRRDAHSYSSQQDAWVLAALLVCPGWLVLTVLLGSLAVHWLLYVLGMRPQDGRKTVPHKVLFNASVWSMAILLASRILDAVRTGPADPVVTALLAPVAAAAVVTAVLQVTVGLVIFAATDMPLRLIVREQAFSNVGLVVQNAGLGALAAMSWLASPLAVLFVLPLFSAMQRSLLHKLLLEQARTDAKTGLANAEFWRQTAEAHVSRSATGGPALSLMVVDLDHFKRVNDTYGHLAGDDVLKEVALRLQSTVRPGDLVGRFGGEEFTVLLPGADPAAAAAVAERVRSVIEAEPMPTGTDSSSASLPVTCSIGVASVLQGDQTALSDVMEAADKALYAAKEGGRNQVRVARAVETT